MMDWLDGRGNSSFNITNRTENNLIFSITKDAKANGLQIMLPSQTDTVELINITINGAPINYTLETIKGIEYAIINVSEGVYNATFGVDSNPPIITNVNTVPRDNSASIYWDTDEVANSRVDYGLTALLLDNNVTDPDYVTTHNIEITGLNPNTKYYYRIFSTDNYNNNASWPVLSDPPANFTTTTPELIDTTVDDFNYGITGSCIYISETYDGELLLAPIEGAEFNGTTIPTGWFGTPWGGGGTTTVDNGIMTLSYSYAGTNNIYDADRSLEFYANFSDETTSRFDNTVSSTLTTAETGGST